MDVEVNVDAAEVGDGLDADEVGLVFHILYFLAVSGVGWRCNVVELEVGKVEDAVIPFPACSVLGSGNGLGLGVGMKVNGVGVSVVLNGVEGQVVFELELGVGAWVGEDVDVVDDVRYHFFRRLLFAENILFVALQMREKGRVVGAWPDDSVKGCKGEYDCYEYETAQKELSILPVDHGDGEAPSVRLFSVRISVSVSEGLEQR